MVGTLEEKIRDEFEKKDWDRDYEQEKEAEREEYIRRAVRSIRKILTGIKSPSAYIKEIDEVMEELKDEIGQI